MVGGSIEDGETPETCIRREIEEELNVDVASLKTFRTYEFGGKTFHVFEVKLEKEPEPSQEDFEEWGWFDETTIKTMEFVLNCKERLLDYIEFDKSRRRSYD